MRRRIGLITLLTADAISAVGNRMSVVAIPWLVLVMTGSPIKMGLAAGAEMLPYVLSGVFAAPLADRFGLRRVSVGTDICSALAMAAIVAVPGLEFGGLVVFVAIAGGLRGIGDRSKHVLLRPVAEAAGVSMLRVTSVYESISRSATLIGAPVGGVLIYWLGAPGAIWVDAASFAVCAVIVGALTRLPATRRAEPESPQAREPYLVALWVGVRCLWSDRLLLGMIAILFASNLFTQAGATVFIPLWVRDALHSSAALGLVGGAFAGGAVLGSVVFTVLANRLPRYLTFALGATLGGAPRLLILGISQELVLVLVVTFLSGVAMASVNPVFGAALYSRVPSELQTRVFGLVAAVCFSGIPLGGVLAGWSVPAFGLNRATLIAGGMCLTISLIPLLGYRSWRRLDDPIEQPVREPART